jgi:hypothetical protein
LREYTITRIFDEIVSFPCELYPYEGGLFSLKRRLEMADTFKRKCGKKLKLVAKGGFECIYFTISMLKAKRKWGKQKKAYGFNHRLLNIGFI